MDDASSAYRPGDGAAPGSICVVVADDSAGMRALLRAQLGTVAGVRILAVPTSHLLGRALAEFGLGLSADGPITMAFGGRPPVDRAGAGRVA